MDTKAIRKPLKKFSKQLPANIQISQMIIFGSYLEGNQTVDSDLDVIVVSDSFTNLDESSRLDMLYKAARDLSPEVQAWGFTPKELESASHLTTLGYARDHGVYV